MKPLVLLAAAASFALAADQTDISASKLAAVKSVYLLPMTNSLDQFLAVRLAKGGAVEIVADPKAADAVMTDHIGASFEEKLNELYADKKKDAGAQASFAGPSSGGGRSKGAIFLVDRRTRAVLWSDYVRPKTAQPADINKAADRIAAELEKEKKGLK